MPHRFQRLESRYLLATINVADFGARPDDGVSDTAAIQAAINNSATGDTIQFGAGRFDVTQITIRSSRTYKGVPGTIIRTSGEWAFTGQPDARDILISGFRFEGAGIAFGQGGVIRNVTIVQNTFADSPWVPLKITNNSDGIMIERNTFINITAYGCIEAYSTNRMSFSRNRIIDSKHGGHILGPLDDCRFNNNHMTGLSIMGLEIQRLGSSVSRNLQVIGNVIYDWKRPVSGAIPLSIVAEGGINTRIANNYVRNSIAAGSDWGTLNHMGKLYGVAIEAGFDSGVVEGNILGGPWRFTNHVGAGGINMLVRNNRFYGTPAWGGWIVGWPSQYGTGTFIDENNLKDPNGANIPLPTLLPGDANNDGSVGLPDFQILAANMGRGGVTFDHGDFNFDGKVNLQDFNILGANFGRTA